MVSCHIFVFECRIFACSALLVKSTVSVFFCQMSKQLETFKSNLEEFASKHKQEIRKNSQFRVQFQEMCATIGVDPLACEKHLGFNLQNYICFKIICFKS